MRVQNISSGYYTKLPVFSAKNDNKERNRYSSVATYTLPVAIAAASILSGVASCDKGDYLDIEKLRDKDTTEVVDSLNEDKPLIDIIVDTTYNEIYEDIIVFSK